MMRLIAYSALLLLVWYGTATSQTPPEGKRGAQTVPATRPTSRTYKTTLVFDRNSLQGALELLSDKIGVPIEIDQRDLQLSGITGCQSFGVDEREQTVEQVLKNILAKANYDGKLVYSVKPNPSGVETVFIGTRQEFEKRGATLFPEFTLGRTERDRAASHKGGPWSACIRPASLEREVRGQIEALGEGLKTESPPYSVRTTLAQLAATFRIIEQYDGKVRWQNQAAAVRQALVVRASRTRFDKWDADQRRLAAALHDDLQGLLANDHWPHAAEPNDPPTWDQIAARPTLMKRLERGYKQELANWNGPEEKPLADRAALVSEAEVIAALARVLQDPSYEYADDEEYARCAKALEQQARAIAAAAEGDDTVLLLEITRLQIHCNNCHSSFR